MIINNLKKADQIVETIAKIFLVLDVSLILILSVLTIVLRWFGVSFLWLDPLVRHMVFLSVFFGGAMATGRGTNICIDIVGTYLRQKDNVVTQRWIQRVISLISALTISWLIYGSMALISVEKEFGQEIFLGIQSWVLVSIIPFGFAMIAFRFFVKFVESFSSHWQPRAHE